MSLTSAPAAFANRAIAARSSATAVTTEPQLERGESSFRDERGSLLLQRFDRREPQAVAVVSGDGPDGTAEKLG
jgi:hypothetical protein